jgi:tRNA(Arg) A34 adenosine deaminase TadA
MLSDVRLSLPRWVADEVGDPEKRYVTSIDRMRLAVRLAERNVAEETGGPFGACIFESETGILVGAGVNVVVAESCSVAHAEAMSIMIAQQSRQAFDLGARGSPRMDLVTSAQPCAQCFGMIWWSGVSGLVIGARREDVEALTGFREGPLPRDWAARLENRAPLAPVRVERDCLRDQACEVLRRYREAGGALYHPGSARG